jgi:hypothetical protein
MNVAECALKAILTPWHICTNRTENAPQKRECPTNANAPKQKGNALCYSEPGVARPRYPRDTNNQTQRTLLRSMFKSRIYAKNVKRPANNVTIARVKKLLQKRQVLIPQIIAERQIAFAC